MAEEGNESVANEEKVDAIAQLRDEMQSQFASLKSAFEEQNAKQQKEIAELTVERDQLKAALVRSAQNPVVPEQPKKTEEELYQDKVRELSEITLQKISAYYKPL